MDSSTIDRVSSATRSVPHVANLQVAGGLMFLAVGIDSCSPETSDKVTTTTTKPQQQRKLMTITITTTMRITITI